MVEIDPPAPKPGRVRVTVQAAAVNPIDVKILRGLMGGSPPKNARGIGIEVAGVVDAVGDGVDAWAVGDEVFGRSIGGGYAESTLAAADALVRRPEYLPWDVAGGLTVAAETAHRTLTELRVTTGDVLLIHAASGAVGLVTTQLAVARGATVIGTASERNHDFLRSLSATPVAYGEGWVERVRAVAPRVDAVLDAAGTGVLAGSVELAGGAERVVTIAGYDEAASLGVRFTGSPEDMVPEPEVAAVVLPLYERGQLRLPIAGRYPLQDAAQALAASGSGHPPGKLVLIP